MLPSPEIDGFRSWINYKLPINILLVVYVCLTRDTADQQPIVGLAL
jgi:hypothetical protein